MRRTLLLLFACSMPLAAGPAVAVSTRVAALGGGDFHEDDRGVLRWYGALADYPNLIVLESGAFTASDGYPTSPEAARSGPAGGVHLRFDETGSWGVAALYLHRRGDDADPGGFGPGRHGETASFLWGRDFGAVTAALAWREYADARLETASTTVVDSRREIGAGVRIDLGEQAYLDLAGEIRRQGKRLEGRNPDGEAWDRADGSSWDNLGLRARAFWGVSPRLVAVPLLELRTDHTPGFVLPGGEPTRNGHRLVRLGCGVNYLADPDNLIVVSAEYSDGRMEGRVEDTGDAGAPPVRRDFHSILARAALERRLAFWLVGRATAGFEHRDPGDGGGGSGQWFLAGGAGLQLADYSLDLALASTDPRRGTVRAPLPFADDALWLSLSFSRDF